MKRTLQVIKWFGMGMVAMVAFQVFGVTAGVLLSSMCGLDLDGQLEMQNFFGSFVAAALLLGAYAVITNLHHGDACYGEEIKSAPRWLWQVPFIACGYLVCFHGGAHMLGTTLAGRNDLALCLLFGGLMSVIIEFAVAAEPGYGKGKAMMVANES